MKVSRRSFLQAGAFAAAAPMIAPRSAAANPGEAGLSIFTNPYPRLFVFRMAEQMAVAGMPYPDWEAMCAPYDGIVCKALNEMRYGREVPRSYMLRFKEAHPDKMVLEHYYSMARSTLIPLDRYFAGSWNYFPGQRSQSAIESSADDTVIAVPDPDLYMISENHPDDLVITSLDANGNPDWHNAEQVILAAKDAEAGTITVRRGQYGTEPRAFAADEAYIAAHVWRRGEIAATEPFLTLWEINYSAAAPRDSDGKTGGDLYAEEIAGYFSAGGVLEPFDGIAFDIFGQFFGADRPQKVDTNGDGVGDNGVVDGVNYWMEGMRDFGLRLRELMGDDRLIVSDGVSFNDQRNLEVFNGIENEGWPIATDPEINDWSSGLNRALLWRERGSAAPHQFSYFQLHYGGLPAGTYVPPPNFIRLFFAASQITDSAVTYGSWQWTPGSVRPDGPEWTLTDWDEMARGTDHVLHWLGWPRHAPVRLAKRSRDQLRGRGIHLGRDFLAQVSGDGVVARREGRWMAVTMDDGASSTKFTIPGIPANGPDLTIFCSVRAELDGHLPARLMTARIIDPLTGEVFKESLPGGHQFGTLIDAEPFEASFYTGNITSSAVDVEFTVEGRQPVWLSSVTAHAAPDAVVREFDHGLVLANPADHDVEFDLASISPSRSYRRLTGSPDQDPVTNNGQPAGDSVTLGARDGLFLVAE